VINLAAAGRSTKTFIQEGRWKKALDAKPDYILIQFGHNDSHAPDQPESTDAATTYKDYLRRYIDESRAIGAMPILVTPMVRRTFDSSGKLIDGLSPYADAMKDVAHEKNASVIDLHASSKALVEKLGPDASAAMANKKGDATHFNEKGARAMADLVLADLPTAEPKLKEYLAQPATVPAAAGDPPNQFNGDAGYHHNFAGDFLSLRPALYAAGQGEAKFRNFKYQALP
jgi:lysophospholipase L1-like esterase